MISPFATQNLQRISIDLLTFITPIKRTQEQKVIDRTRERFKNLLGQKLAFYDNTIKGYALGVRVPCDPQGAPTKAPSTDEQRTTYVKFHLKRTRLSQGATSNHLRITLNPSRFTVDGLLAVRKLVEDVIQGSYSKFIPNAHLTELDIAFDFPNISLDDFVFGYSKKRTWRTFGKGANIETICLGATKTRERVRVYDKGLKDYKDKKTTSRSSLVRIEHCFRPRNDKELMRKAHASTDRDLLHQVSLRDIPIFLKMINRLSIYDIKGIQKDADVPPHFADSCRLRTVNGALGMLDKTTEKRIRRRLGNYYKLAYLDDSQELMKKFQSYLLNQVKPLHRRSPTI